MEILKASIRVDFAAGTELFNAFREAKGLINRLIEGYPNDDALVTFTFNGVLCRIRRDTMWDTFRYFYHRNLPAVYIKAE